MLQRNPVHRDRFSQLDGDETHASRHGPAGAQAAVLGDDGLHGTDTVRIFVMDAVLVFIKLVKVLLGGK